MSGWKPKHIIVLLIGMQPFLVALLLLVAAVTPVYLLFQLLTLLFKRKPKKKEARERWTLEGSRLEYEKATAGLTTRRDFSKQ